MTLLNIATFNVNGINEYNKRNSIFRKLRDMNLDIICLQETHIEAQNIETVKKHWQQMSIWSPGPSGKSRGVAILFKSNNITILDKYTDETGLIELLAEAKTMGLTKLC